MNATLALKRPRTKPAEIRREELMDAAQRLFLEKGFDETSVDEIVRAAHVAKGTFYWYFKSKDDVLLALQTRFIDRFCSEIEEAVGRLPENDWSGRLDTWLETAVNGYLDQVAVHDLIFHDIRPSNRRMKQDNPVITPLATFLEAGARHGAWVAEDARLAAVMVFSALHGAVDDSVVASVPIDRNALIKAVRSFCRRALACPAP